MNATSPGTGRLTRGRQAASDRRRTRLTAAVEQAAAGQIECTVAAITRAAGVHRSFPYRHPDLLQLIHHTAAGPPSLPDNAAERVSVASLRADLAHARDRARRLETRVRELEAQLSRRLGDQVWTATGLGAEQALANAEQARLDLEHRLRDLDEELDERTEELAAARAANRELMTRLNAPPPPTR